MRIDKQIKKKKSKKNLAFRNGAAVLTYFSNLT